jgi:hypothetical protein
MGEDGQTFFGNVFKQRSNIAEACCHRFQESCCSPVLRSRRPQEAGVSPAAPSATTAPGRLEFIKRSAREQSLVATKEGQRIGVPEGSPLRSELMIAVVTVRQIQRALELPAAVEADPARTVKVLPPTAGRVVHLKAQLGDRVVPQQELAVIHVGDLAHTDFDNRKALAKRACHWQADWRP